MGSAVTFFTPSQSTSPSRQTLALWAWAYPLYWLAASTARGIPAFRGSAVSRVEITFGGIQALTRPDPSSQWLGVFLILAAGLATGPWGGLLLINGGLLYAERFTAWFLMDRLDPVAFAGVALFLLGIFRSRLGCIQLAAGVLIPQTLLRLLLAPRRQFALYIAAAAIVALAFALVATCLRPRWQFVPVRWRAALSLTLLLGASSYAGSVILRETQSKEQIARLAAARNAPKPDRYTQYFFQKGVSFTAEGGVGYDHPLAVEMLAKLPAYGVDSIALIPYGWMDRGQKTIRAAGNRGWESDNGIRILTGEAHRLGMKVLLKPHVWRLQGKDRIPKEESREWMRNYLPFILEYARLAAEIHADLFCIGTELETLTMHEDEWRNVIAEVRKVYPGPLTYAANHGPEFESIRFWDALDYIGLDNYYPLDANYAPSELLPKLHAVQQQYKLPVIFTEAGFGAHKDSRTEPWADETNKPLDLAEQARAYDGVLKAFSAKPWFHGAYWWKVGTNGYGGPDNNSMTPWGKPAMEVLKRWYLK
jgi:hypothetical protein